MLHREARHEAASTGSRSMQQSFNTHQRHPLALLHPSQQLFRRLQRAPLHIPPRHVHQNLPTRGQHRVWCVSGLLEG